MLRAATFDDMIEQDAAACDALGLARLELELIDDAVADNANTVAAAAPGAIREQDLQDRAERLHHLTDGMAKASGRLLYVEALLCPTSTKTEGREP